MSLKKLLLATAIAAVSSASFGMEAMDDGSMSSTTGQDGLSLTLNTKLTLDMYIHDNDGFTGALNPGAIGLKGFGLSDGLGGNAGFKIDIDAGSVAAGSSPILQIGISTTTAGGSTSIALGNVTASNSVRTAASTLTDPWTRSNETGALVSLGTLTFANTNLLNIQMGNESQGAWMKLAATFTGGLTLTGFALNDLGGAVNGGGIHGDVAINNANNDGNLNVDLGIDANATGLVVKANTLGTTGMNVRVADLRLGAAAAPNVGDVEIVGLNLNGSTINISGH